MRARLPAFEGFHGGELALLSLSTLRTLRTQVVEMSLLTVVEQLAEIGVSAIAIAGLDESRGLSGEDMRTLDAAQARANDLAVPLLALPSGTPLAEIEREVLALVSARREPVPADAYAATLRESLRGEALDALLTGTYASDAAMRSRALQLGYDLSQPHAALWIDVLGVEQRAPGRTATNVPHPQAERLAEALSAGIGAWAHAREQHVAALVPAARIDRALGEVRERVETLLIRSFGDDASGGLSWAGGLGDVATAPAQAHRSATEARDAARLGLIVLGPCHIARQGDLGVYKLLLALRDSGELAPFVERTLAPLLADSRAGDSLAETLEAFFESNGNLSEAARRLHLHRNSLIYRLNRARELLGHDLDDPELRLALHLALKGRRVLGV
jgi:sugar diacid utilization regulator